MNDLQKLWLREYEQYLEKCDYSYETAVVMAKAHADRIIKSLQPLKDASLTACPPPGRRPIDA